MLEFLRSSVGGWVAKIFIGILVISFAVWGVADMLRGATNQPLAKVGDVEISPRQFEDAYRAQIRLLSRQFGRQLTNDMARRLGIDSNVLSMLVGGAALDNHAMKLGLSISDDFILQQVATNPAFQNSDGSFNKTRFLQLLRDAQISQAGYLRDQKKVAIRKQLADAVNVQATVPSVLTRIQNEYENEQRSIKYFVLPPTALKEIKAPTEKQLQAFYETRKGQFKTPELRKSNILSLTLKDMVPLIQIGDEDLKKEFEAKKDSFGTPERREIWQITFPSLKEARKAVKNVKTKADFLALAKKRGLKQKDISLGLLTKKEMIDPLMAKAAFALPQGKVSDLIAGQLSTAILYINDIKPKVEKSFADVKDQLLHAMRKHRAEIKIEELQDKVEELRASGLSLKEIGEKLKIPYLENIEVDQTGKDKNGKPDIRVGTLPGLASAIFESEVGMDNDPVEVAGNGFVWFELVDITPAKDKPLKEVKDELVKKWKENERIKALFKLSGKLVARLEKEGRLDKMAAKYKATLMEEKGFKRETRLKDLPATVVTQAFFLKKGDYSSARTKDGKNRLIFQVADVKKPAPLDKKARKEMEARFLPQLRNDAFDMYIAGLRTRYGVAVNQGKINKIIGVQ